MLHLLTQLLLACIINAEHSIYLRLLEEIPVNPIYEWLYEYYAKPRLSSAQLSFTYHIQSQEWQAVAEQLSRHDRLLSYDLMDTIRNDWGALVFACGVQFGISLVAGLSKKTEP